MLIIDELGLGNVIGGGFDILFVVNFVKTVFSSIILCLLFGDIIVLEVGEREAVILGLKCTLLTGENIFSA